MEAHTLFVLALEKTTVESEYDKHHDTTEDNAQTIKANKSPGPTMTSLSKPPAAEIGPIVEDYSDLGAEDDQGTFETKLADFKVCMRCSCLTLYPLHHRSRSTYF